MNTNQTREFHIELEQRADNSEPIVTASISSETPVEMGFGMEVLEHTQSAVDLSRSPLPLITSHDRDETPVGIVEGLRLEGKRLVGRLRFGASERAKELLADVRSGVLRNLSVGYQVVDWIQQGDTYRVTRWMPYEVSLVSVPADASVGIGRSLKETKMTTETENKPTVVQMTPTEWQAEERARREAIRATFNQGAWNTRGDAYDRLQTRLLDDPTITIERARKELFELISASSGSQPLSQEAAPRSDAQRGYGGPGRQGLVASGDMDLSKYSIVDAILAQVDVNHPGGGFEREVSREIQNRTGMKARNGGILVPLNAPYGSSSLAQRDLTAGGATSGGPMVGTQHTPEEFIDVLRNRSVVLQLGARMLTGLVQNVSVPRKTAPGTVAWFDLDGTATITASDAAFDSVLMSPSSLAGLSGYSHRMLTQGLPDTEMVITQDILGSIAETLDQTALQGTGVAAEPSGLSLLASSKPTYTDGALTYVDVTDLESAVYSAGGDTTGSLGFVMASDLVGAAKSTQKFTNGGTGIADGSGGDGTLQMSGYRTLHTNGAPAGSIYFGSWSQLWVGSWGAVEVLANPYSSFDTASVAVRAILDADIAVRHPESFGFLAPL